MNLRLELDGLRILGLRASLGFRFRARDGLGLAKFALKPVGLLKFALKLGCNGKVKAKLIVIKKKLTIYNEFHKLNSSFLFIYIQTTTKCFRSQKWISDKKCDSLDLKILLKALNFSGKFFNSVVWIAMPRIRSLVEQAVLDNLKSETFSISATTLCKNVKQYF